MENDRHDSNKDFRNLIAATNESPWGIWSTNDVMWVLDWEDNKIYAYNSTTKQRILVNNKGNRDIDNLKGPAGKFRGIWWDGETMWVANAKGGRNLYAYNLPQPTARTRSGPSEDASLKDLRLSGVTLTPAFSPAQRRYTAMVSHDVVDTTVTATPNDLEAAVEIFWASDEAASRETARRGAQVTLEEGYNLIVMDVEAENGRLEIYFVEVTKAEAPPVSGGPLPQPQSFQTSPTSSASQTDLASSLTGLEWKSRLIFAEPLASGSVRFVFLVPAEEFQMEETVDLLGETWRPLPEDEVQILRKSNGNGSDRLTVILPKAEGKQRFLRLTPQR